MHFRFALTNNSFREKAQEIILNNATILGSGQSGIKTVMCKIRDQRMRMTTENSDLF